MPPQEDGAAAAPSASESAKATGAAGAVTIQIGTTVRIHGLKSKPELNGKEGVVTAQKEARWVVQPSGEGFAPLALKETNLAVVVAQEDAAAKQTQEVQQHVFFSFFPFFSFPFSPASSIFTYITAYHRLPPRLSMYAHHSLRTDDSSIKRAFERKREPRDARNIQ